MSQQSSTASDVRALMEENLEVLRNYRHDLMNHVQLLRAYAQMKKYERMEEPIAAMIEEAQRHTEFSTFPSSLVGYAVLSRDIRFSMLKLHVSYEQHEAPSLDAELQAARLLSDLLDHLGEISKTLLEPLPVDVWIASFRQGYEIGWIVCGHAEGETPVLNLDAWAARWGTTGLELSKELTEDGVEYSIRFEV